LITTAAILAGGMGTRLGSLTESRPKPMLEICGKPLLEHQIEVLKRHGVRKVVILSRHQAHVIQEHLGDGSRMGIEILHVVEDGAQGTGGALRGLQGVVSENFFLVFGDVVFDMDMSRLAARHEKHEAIATLAVHPTDHPLDSDLVDVGRTDQVRQLLLKPHRHQPDCNLGNAGLYCLSPLVLDFIPHGPCDLMKDILPVVLKAKQPVAAYRTPEYIRDMGTPNRLDRVSEDMASGRVSARSLDRPQSAVFLDRDGTLIELVNQLNRMEDIRPFPFSAGALERLNRSNHLSVLVTNQPVVARNLCSLEDVHDMHNHLEALLGKDRGWLDALYFCPHHPDSGYPEENPEFKIACACRKPGTGMFEQAARDLNIDLAASWMVGDTTVDIQAGLNAGLKTILVRTGQGGRDRKFDAMPDYVAEDLPRAVDIIMEAGQ